MAQRRRIRKKKRVPPLRRAGKLAYRILVVLSAIIVVLYCAYRLASKKPTQAPEPTPEAPAGSLSPDQTEAPGRQRREGTYTFLLAASDQSSGNADTIIVASYDTEAQKVGMVSVPRDTLLESGKINAAYHKGPENLRDTVSNLLGVPIDYYVAVDVDGFVALVDELGGIEFDVPVRMSFDDPTQDLHIHYQPGLQHLTGEDVLKVARCRNNSDGPGSYPDNLYGAYPDGDIGRTRTQQQLIAAILKKALSNPQKINSYVNLFLEYVDTDLEFSEALWFAQPALGLDFSTALPAPPWRVRMSTMWTAGATAGAPATSWTRRPPWRPSTPSSTPTTRRSPRRISTFFRSRDKKAPLQCSGAFLSCQQIGPGQIHLPLAAAEWASFSARAARFPEASASR